MVYLLIEKLPTTAQLAFSALVFKSANSVHVHDALQEPLRGRKVGDIDRLLDAGQAWAPGRALPSDALLTRLVEAYRPLCEGNSNKAIADALGLSKGAVKH